MLIANAGADAQRPESGDVALDVLTLDRRLQVLDVGLDHRLARIGQRPRAGAALARVGLAHLAGGGEAGTHRTAGAGEPQAGGEEAGEVAPVTLRRAVAFRRLRRVQRHGLVPRHAVLDIAAVAAGLGVLAVVDDVDAQLDLLVDDVLHRLGQARSVLRAERAFT